MNDLVEENQRVLGNLRQLGGLCPKCGDEEHSKEPFFVRGDEKCSSCSKEAA